MGKRKAQFEPRNHFTFRINETTALSLDEFGENKYSVSYLTKASAPLEGWDMSNTQYFENYNEALRVFRGRRDSPEPFAAWLG